MLLCGDRERLLLGTDADRRNDRHGRQADGAKSSREELWTHGTNDGPSHWDGIGKPSQKVAERTCGVKIDGVWLRITGDLAVGSLATGAD
jgi:hypothetical protein